MSGVIGGWLCAEVLRRGDGVEKLEFRVNARQNAGASAVGFGLLDAWY